MASNVVRKVRMKTGTVNSRFGKIPKATAGHRKIMLNKSSRARKDRAVELKHARKFPSLSSTTRLLLRQSDSKRTKGNAPLRSMLTKIKKDYHSSGRYANDRESLKRIRRGEKP